jgi:hypothetical protein
MKTAMQELLEEFDNMPEYLFYTYLKVKRDELIEKEKEQIIEAHFEGWSDAYDYLSEFNNDKARQAEEYYEETYEKE